ncbi:neuronal-specific septin-3-like [Amphiura filiformis]|uniref:neuronal-specific septin-3-like n=1 Tax=Amphiura filiformis TaxID=82378 RepID=UPI003B2263FD
MSTIVNGSVNASMNGGHGMQTPVRSPAQAGMTNGKMQQPRSPATPASQGRGSPAMPTPTATGNPKATSTPGPTQVAGGSVPGTKQQGMTLSDDQYQVLRKAFHEVDTEKTGSIDSSLVPQIAKKILGTHPFGLHNDGLLLQPKEVGKNGLIQFSDFVGIMSEAMSQTTQWGALKTDIKGYVGIDTLQEQIRKKALKKGFEFNIMVVGASGLGKSTLVNTLFKAKVSRRSCAPEKDQIPIIPKTVEVKAISHVIEENGVRLKLTVTDTPGFGDHINNENCWLPILEFINEQYEKFLSEEINISRKKQIPDSRVHVCLYFIAPTGHSLKPLDTEFMKKLDKVVNVIPVIAKADTLTVEERTLFKQRIMADLGREGISTYPMKDLEMDDEDAQINESLRFQMPFAVVGSDKSHTVDGNEVLGRLTNWGLIEVENPNHCEFANLRDMLIRTHLQDLKDVTHSIHYENFRYERLQARQKFDKADESRC